MAIVVTDVLGTFPTTGTSVASLTTGNLTVGASIGDLVLVFVGSDNSGANGASPIASVSDSKGNTYVLLNSTNRTAGAANDGVSIAIYGSIITVALGVGAGNTITVNFSPNTSRAVIGAAKVTGANTTSTGSNSGSGLGTTWSIASVTPGAVGDLVVVFTVSETATIPGVPGVGGFAAIGSATAGSGGGDATKISAKASYTIASSTSSISLSGTSGANTDWAALYLLYTLASGGVNFKSAWAFDRTVTTGSVF